MPKEVAVQIRNDLEINKSLYIDFNMEVAIGDYAISDDGDQIFKVVDIYQTPEEEYDRVKKKNVETGKLLIMIVADAVKIRYSQTERTDSISEWRRDRYSFYRGDIDKLRQQVLNELVSGENKEPEPVESTSTEIAVLNKDLLSQQKSMAIELQNIVKAKRSLLKSILDEKLNQLRVIQDKFEVIIERVSKVIYTLEIYLGVNEDIVQIQKGVNASNKEPVHFRQKLMYMDTEMADPDNGGIDYNDIKQFEDWMLKENSYHKKPNYQISVPEEKCVVAFRVRENPKERHGWHPLEKAQAEMWDNKTYIFIRNGTNIYSIWADINIHPRLFPQQDEFIKKLDFWEEEKKEDNILHYKLQILLMQGLIERTPIFQPLSQNINLFDPEVHNSKLVKFIYDDEASLTDGTISFKEWRERVNKGIKEGSRVVLSGSYGGWHYGEGFAYRRLWKMYYSHESNAPSAPSAGIYTVYGDEKTRWEKEPIPVLKIMYNPKDEIGWNSWDYDPHERKNRLSFLISADDTFLVHWDGITKKDIDMLEAMIWDRRNRADYLSSMPSLVKIIELKRKEIEQENNFIKLVYGMNMDTFSKYSIWEKPAIKLIQDAVEWWKLKNKWKRSLDTDDSKALKMIGQRVCVPSRLKKLLKQRRK